MSVFKKIHVLSDGYGTQSRFVIDLGETKNEFSHSYRLQSVIVST